MRNEMDGRLLSRRSVLTLAGACLIPWESLYAGEFWDKKDPSQWTGEEIDRLTTKSPWARAVTAQYAPGESGGQGGCCYYPLPGPLPGPVIRPFPRTGGGRGGRGGAQSNLKGTVRWESAQPILDALKNPLPEAFANLCAIGIREIPLLEERARNDDDLDKGSEEKRAHEIIENLKRNTVLQPKGREMVEPSVVQRMTPGGTYFLFGFSKARLDFGKKDQEVDFSTRLGRLLVKTKFDLTLMKYHGKLAV